MSFQPSEYSYGGWWADWREIKVSQRKSRRAGTQVKPLPQNSKKLWKVKYPWGDRQKMSSATGASRALTPLAMGKQPLVRLRKPEYRATIYGAVKALNMSGVPPYASMNVDGLSFKARGSKAKKNDAKLLAWAREGAKAAGKKRKWGLRGGAAFMRKEAIDQNLEEAAWAGRALALLGLSARRSAIAGASHGAAASGLQTSAAAMAASSAGPQAIFTLPAAGVLQGLSALAGVWSAKTGIQAKKAKAEYAQFDQFLQQAYQRRSLADQAMITSQMEEQSKAKDREAQVLVKEVEAAGEKSAQKAGKVITYSVAAGVAVIFIGYLAGRSRA
tara:strand:+ start:3872 stop:4861 length:990 start_codon:yes stop_codon:yes gene_type:complete